MGAEPNDNESAQQQEEIRHFYDEVYYGNAAGAVSTPSAHDERLAERLGVGAGHQVLDVACGLGGWLKACDGRGARVSGVDLSDAAIDVCRRSMPEGSFSAQTADSLPFEDNHFDFVTCLGSLEHFLDPVASVREMARVAKPGAPIILLVPNKDFLTRRLGLFAGTYQVDAMEVVRTLDEWQVLFQQSGLTVEERWKDLHILSWQWITIGPFYKWPLRLLQALVLPLWPLQWQYQVYHRCRQVV